MDVYFIGRVQIPVPVGRASLVSHKAKSVTELAAKYEADPRKAAALARAREKLADRLGRARGEATAATLAQLRLQKGLSQTRLAEILGLKQPYVARVERGEENLTMSTMENFAAALGVAPPEFLAAALASRSARQA